MLLLGACGLGGGEEETGLEFSDAETRVDYEVELTGAPSEEVDEVLTASLRLYRFQENGAQSPAFLRRRADADVETVLRVLRSFGYFDGSVSTRIMEGEPALAIVAIEPGPLFTLAAHNIVAVDPAGAPVDLPAEVLPGTGVPAEAETILDAEGVAVAHLQTTGRPYAALQGRQAIADRETATLEVTTTIETGAAYVFGPPVFSGGERVARDYLRTYVTWDDGAPVDLNELGSYQRELLTTDLFNAGSVSLPETPPEGPVLSPVVRLEERPFRTVSGVVNFSTDTGPGGGASFEHRNLFGSNETVNAEVGASLEEQFVELRYIQPQWRRPGQDLNTELRLERIDDDAFESLSATAALGVERELTPRWRVGAGGLIEISEIDGTDDEGTSLLGGLPVYAIYDSSDDLLDPSRGARLRTNVTPFAGTAEFGDPIFLVVDTTGSAYFDLTGEKAYILATRGRIGTIFADDLSDVPSNRRLFSGGGGSVRAFENRFIGPLDDDDDPTGGLSVVEAGVELRARVFGDFGVAIFGEAGAVADSIAPSFEDGLLFGAGLGLRYASPVGPLRLDFAVPINPRSVDDAVQIYLSLGQAF